MKPGIHPTFYPEAKVTCASCGRTWTTGSTKKEFRVDICAECHPFFTGEASRLLDIEGQVDRFYKKLSVRQNYVEAQKVKEELKGSPERPIEDLGLAARANASLKAAGITNVGQFLEKLDGGNDAALAIAGFGQASLTAAKKKLRALGYELPEAAA
ncbi:MAG: 50S ribosomal protein L31 [Anaerolineales bacterium]|nr:50S ribosomal protein L31 [Anaerolineales bacterium]MCL4261115.1 50S ribosomal protein L31 [Anaerolineales bacterium]